MIWTNTHIFSIKWAKCQNRAEILTTLNITIFLTYSSNWQLVLSQNINRTKGKYENSWNTDMWGKLHFCDANQEKTTPAISQYNKTKI